MQLTAEVLGPLRVSVDGSPVDLGGPRQRRLLGALLVEHGSVVSRDRLIEATFEGIPPDAAQRTFRTYVARLRRALEVAGIDAATVLVTEPNGYVVPDDALSVDSERFESALADAQDRLSTGDADGATLLVEEALGLWSGPAYGEFADEEWASVEAIRLTELRTVAQEVRSEALIESGRHAAAIADLEALIDDQPFREQPRQLLMLALYRSGRHADALRAAREYRRFIAEETGLEPSRQLNELEQLIIDQDPRLEARPQGRKLRGYRLGPPIAESELGITYRATQPSVDRTVAIIAIPPDQADDPEFVRRFEIHAQRIASIEHPNVVPLYDYWREPGGAYLVTRHLSGGSLERRLTDEAVGRDDRLRIVHEVGDALAAAHERGVVHGQLTASRVLFDEAGTAYVAGFALDASRASTPDDIAALGRLADELWKPPAESEDATRAAAAVATRVRRLAERAEGAGQELPFPTIADMVAAIDAAVADPATVPASRSAPTIEGPNPYRGLRPFAETDVDLFFGRERLVSDIIDELRAHPFIAIIGPSGSGKSSVVHAGLFPHLRASGALVTTMTPGDHPLAELEFALTRIASTPLPDFVDELSGHPAAFCSILREITPDPANQVVLAIDQFEEAFTQSDPGQRDVLLAALDAAIEDRGTGLNVVIAARADFLGPILEHRTVGAAVRDHSRLVTPLDPTELHDAIVGPAETAGVAVEPALASTLVTDAASSPNSLPLLQYALTELYEHRVDGTMTIGAYQRIGGMGAVLSQRAEEIFSGLDGADRESSRRLFTRLVTPMDGADDTRRRSTVSELVGVSNDLLTTYGRARLISFDRDPTTREPTVEVAHEALIREWARLRGWISEDREGARILLRLSASAAEWHASGRDDGELYRGTRLAVADEWATEHAGELSTDEREFIDASRRSRDGEAERDRRHVRRLRSLLVAATIVAVIALVAGVIAVVQRREANENAREADLRRVIAEAQAAVDGDPNRALLLALEAYRVDPSLETLGTVQATGIGGPTSWLGDIENGTTYRRVAFLSGRSLVAASDVAIEVWGVDDRVLLRSVTVGAPVSDLDVRGDGSLIAVSGVDGSWLVLDATTLDRVTAGRIDDEITVIRLDPVVDQIALGTRDGTVRLRSIDGAGIDVELHASDVAGEPDRGAVADLSISQDGRHLAAAWGVGNVAQQWGLPVATTVGRPIGTIDARAAGYVDGNLFVAGVQLQGHDPDSGVAIGAAIELPGGIDVNSRIASAGGSVIEIFESGSRWTVDLDTGVATRTSYEAVGSASLGAVSPDGSVLVFAMNDGLSFWALDGAGIFVDAVVPSADEYTQIVAITADGSTVVQGGNISDDVPTVIWDTSGARVERLGALDRGKAVRVVGNDVVVFERSDSTLAFSALDPATLETIALMEADFETFGANVPRFSPDRTEFLHPWNGQGLLDVYDVEGRLRTQHLSDVEDAAPGQGNWPGVPQFTRDGGRLVYPTYSGFVAIYDAETWTLEDLLDSTDGFWEIVFTPDRERAITLSSRGLELRDATDLRSILSGPFPGPDELAVGSVLELTSDGRFVKIAGVEGPQLWDASSLQPIGAEFPHDRDVWAATLAADTNQLVTNVEGAGVIWNIDLEEWPDLACLAAGRNLTRAEWDEFGPRGPYHATCDRWPTG